MGGGRGEKRRRQFPTKTGLAAGETHICKDAKVWLIREKGQFLRPDSVVKLVVWGLGHGQGGGPSLQLQTPGPRPTKLLSGRAKRVAVKESGDWNSLPKQV